MRGATLVVNSGNKKLGNCSVTMLSQKTCPDTCPFLPDANGSNGCYANTGNTRFVTNRLNQSDDTGMESALHEMELLSQLMDTTPSRYHKPLRLHVVGDFVDGGHVLGVAAILRNYANAIWGYTHAWRKLIDVVPALRALNVLASCHTWSEVWTATQYGLASAITVDKHPDDGKAWKHSHKGDTYKVIPCPAQTRATTCDKCRLCWDASRNLGERMVISFALHGATKQATRALGGKLIQIEGARNA